MEQMSFQPAYKNR